MRPSTWLWRYVDRKTCLILEEDESITVERGEPIKYGARDLVVFSKIHSCKWEVHKEIKNPIFFVPKKSKRRS